LTTDKQEVGFYLPIFNRSLSQVIFIAQKCRIYNNGYAILSLLICLKKNYFLKGGFTMPKYVIEREIPEAGKLSVQDLQGISQKSCDVLNNLGSQIQWVQSYVTDDKIYCVYIAPNEEMVREHARQGGFPANSVSEVRSVIDPTTAEV
jgi:hypothetical protein